MSASMRPSAAPSERAKTLGRHNLDVEDRLARFLGMLSELKKFDDTKEGEAMRTWVDEKMRLLSEKIAASSISPYIEVDAEQLREAYEFAYIAHFGQKRKVQDKIYAEHLHNSVERYIGIKEKEYDDRRPPEEHRVDLTADFMKLLLHDVLEDFLKGVKLSEDKPDEDKMRWFTSLQAHMVVRFGVEVSNFVTNVATKFTKRPFTLILGKPSKMALSRLDLIALILGITNSTHNANELLLKAAERQDNLATVGNLPRAYEKAKETYNMAMACYACGFRSPGKDLLDRAFRYLYQGDKKQVLEAFEQKIQARQEEDRQLFESIEASLRDEIEERLGHSDFDINYRPLQTWRIHEELMHTYKIMTGDEDLSGLNLLPDGILDDEEFNELLEKRYQGRIVIKTRDWADTGKIARMDLPSFEHLDRQVHSGHSFGGEKTMLQISDYKAERVLAVHQDHPNHVLEIKVTSRKADHKNEFGAVRFAQQPDGSWREKYSDARLRKFVDYLGEKCDEIKPGSFDVVRRALSQPTGADLSRIGEEVQVLMQAIEEMNLYDMINTRVAHEVITTE